MLVDYEQVKADYARKDREIAELNEEVERLKDELKPALELIIEIARGEQNGFEKLACEEFAERHEIET